MGSADTLTALSVYNTLSSKQDQQCQHPIKFSYNYLENCAEYIKPPSLRLNEYMRSGYFLRLGNAEDTERRPDAINLYPSLTGISWATGFESVRQNKHWKEVARAITDFLQSFVGDKFARKTVLANGTTLAEMVEKEIPILTESWLKFCIYMVPEADLERAKLIGVAHLLVFLFDEPWEMCDIKVSSYIRNEFKACAESNLEAEIPLDSAIHGLITWLIRGLRDQDHIAGNGGHDIIQGLMEFCDRSHPQESFKDMGEYLKFRYEDGALPFVYACAKFSLRSSIDVHNPKLQRILNLLGHQITTTNDLCSWAKELRDYESKRNKHLFNAVEIMRQHLSLTSYDAAKALTYAFQLQLELDIDAEISQLLMANDLTAAEWRFVDAVLHTASGHVLSSGTMVRYGGQRLAD